MSMTAATPQKSGVTEIDECRPSSASDCSVETVDLEAGLRAGDLHSVLEGEGEGEERDCRICHLSLDAANQDTGGPIELGCSCKDDLAAAHKHCAEAWFKIKGNRTCEICGSLARNVSGPNDPEPSEQWSMNEAMDSLAVVAAPPVQQSEARNFWQGHRFLNFLLACMVFAFVISWLFHFNIPS